MKLYRGLKAVEYKEYSSEVLKKYRSNWQKILRLREKGDLDYPHDLNKDIGTLKKHEHLVRQYFTDDKKTAERYAKEQKGVLVEIDVPIGDILEHFILEFQNYTKRKERFEITYIVRGKDLVKYAESWKLRVSKS